MGMREIAPEAASKMLQAFSYEPAENYLFGDVTYEREDLPPLISDYEEEWGEHQNRPPELEAALINFKKQAAAELIQNIVTVETYKGGHGAGNPFILVDNGNLYMATTSTSHGDIVAHLMDEIGLQEDNF